MKRYNGTERIGIASMQSFLKSFLPLLLLALCFCTCALAENGNNPDNAFMQLKQRLVKDGFKSSDINRIYSDTDVSFELKGVSLFFVHSESSLDYDQFLSGKSIQNALNYMQTHKPDLENAQEKYGVDKTVITAIILVETRLGTYLGNRTILNTLSTMAALEEKPNREALWESLADSKRINRQKFEKKADKKAKWAYSELKAFLKFAAKEGLVPSKIKGSYAGAMGICQFMPSNALTLARDGNGDGKINLFHHPDAIHSIANYLKRYGWEPAVNRQKAHKILYQYNHSNFYVDTLLKISDRLKS